MDFQISSSDSRVPQVRAQSAGASCRDVNRQILAFHLRISNNCDGIPIELPPRAIRTPPNAGDKGRFPAIKYGFGSFSKTKYQLHRDRLLSISEFVEEVRNATALKMKIERG